MMRASLLLLTATAVQAFSPSTISASRSRAMASSPCFLTIDDGMDLVAASQQVYRRQQQQQDDNQDEYFEDAYSLDDDNITVVMPDAFEPSLITAPRGAALAFVRRLFAHPTAAFHPDKTEALDSYEGDEDDDVVYFPIVGFTFVRDGPNHCRALPSVSNPSCRIRGDVCDHIHYGTWAAPK